MELWDIVGTSILAGFGAHLGWGAALGLMNAIDAFWSGFKNGKG